MRHTPRSEDEAPAPGGVLQPGEYDAVVKKATDKVSKSGNEMIEIILTCYTAAGGRSDVFDYLVGTDSWAWKIRHFCESAGLPYGSGEILAKDCEERNVRVRLEIKKDEYGTKNVVGDYLPVARSVKVTPGVAAGAEDDDIPF